MSLSIYIPHQNTMQGTKYAQFTRYCLILTHPYRCASIMCICDRSRCRHIETISCHNTRRQPCLQWGCRNYIRLQQYFPGHLQSDTKRIIENTLKWYFFPHRRKMKQTNLNTLSPRQNKRHCRMHSWMKMCEFRWNFHWSLFPKIQLKYSSICSDDGLAQTMRQAIIWTNGG